MTRKGAPKARVGENGGARMSLALTALALALTAIISTASLYFELPSEARSFVLIELRLPRLLVGLLVGSTLGLVGAVFQTLFQNPLATPSTLGTSAGAALGALLSLVFGLSGLGGLSAATLSAFAGALAATFLVLFVASSARARLEEILLAGIAVTLAAGAASQALHAVADESQLFAAAMWSLGHLPQVGYDRVQLLAAPCLVTAFILLSQSRALATLALGESWAQSMGVSTRRLRLLALICGCLGVAVSVALCGLIAFVGLLVPHLAAPLTRGRRHLLFVLSWIGGAGFLVLSDLVARVIVPERELPVGAVTAALGAPALFWVIAHRRRAS